MAFFDKINQLANTAGEKASGAIEIGKLNVKVSGEEKKITSSTMQLGECLLQKLDAGEGFDESIMSLYAQITTARETASALRKEIALFSGNIICDKCQAENSSENKFCKSCGAPIISDEPVVAEVIDEKPPAEETSTEEDPTAKP